MISKYVRDAVKAQLSDPQAGLNYRLSALAGGYGMDAAYEIDWSGTSQNFIFGRVAPEQFEETSAFSYPLLTIDTVRTQDTRRIKFATFAGPVVATIDVHHSWIEESVLADFASMVDLTEDAVISCMNDQSGQNWPGNLLWNGSIATQRGPIKMGGMGWLQSVQFVCNFELVV